MKKTGFTEAQIAFVLRKAEERTAVAEVCRKAGISEATFYNWRKKYGRNASLRDALLVQSRQAKIGLWTFAAGTAMPLGGVLMQGFAGL